MRLAAFLLVSLLSGAAAAETLRIAIARGPSLEVLAGSLVARVDDAEPESIGASLTLKAVGSLVSYGERLVAKVALEDASGGDVSIGGRLVLGHAEVVATEAGLVAIDEVELETYVASVLGAEMSPSWPAAALEAQAVAARTYALTKKQRAKAGAPFHLEATVSHQVYRGHASMDMRTVLAADATRGLVLVYGDALADTYFFASCAGRTASSEEAFGTAVPYLVPATCEGGEKAPALRWTRTVDVMTLGKALLEAKAIGDRLIGVEVASRTPTGRAAKFRLKTKRSSRLISAAEFRRFVGYRELPSLDVDAAMKGSRLVLTGRGAGHGVGLCQWCARGQALAGAAAADILRRYYPGTKLVPLDELR